MMSKKILALLIQRVYARLSTLHFSTIFQLFKIVVRVRLVVGTFFVRVDTFFIGSLAFAFKLESLVFVSVDAYC